MFDDLDTAKRVRDEMAEECGELSLFMVNLVFSGEVVE
jgi:hypothetical protein